MNDDRQTALDLARTNGHMDVVQLIEDGSLEEYQVKVTRDAEGSHPSSVVHLEEKGDGDSTEPRGGDADKPERGMYCSSLRRSTTRNVGRGGGKAKGGVLRMILNAQLVKKDRVGANGLLQMNGSTSEKSPPSKGQSSNTDMLQRKSANPKSTKMSSIDYTIEQKCEILDWRRNIVATGRVHTDSNQMTSDGMPCNKDEEVALIVDVIHYGHA